MSKNKQSNITAGKNVVAGDLYDVTFEADKSSYVLLEKLYARYKDDALTQKITDKIITDLASYEPLTTEQQNRDLKSKLTDAGREKALVGAFRYKQVFRQRVEEFRLFASAQAIYAHLLGEVMTRFDACVLPAIEAGASEAEIRKILHDDVVHAIIEMVPEIEPTCDHPTLYGMVYFLTGNCFLEWQ